jgi:hypothetical protein
MTAGLHADRGERRRAARAAADLAPCYTRDLRVSLTCRAEFFEADLARDPSADLDRAER